MTETMSSYTPRISLSSVMALLNTTLYMGPAIVCNDKLYGIAEKISSLAYPSSTSGFLIRWEYFYLPVYRVSCNKKEFILIPVALTLERDSFLFEITKIGSFSVAKNICFGKQIISDPEDLKLIENILISILEFCDILKRNPDTVHKYVPYEFRLGTIEGKYIMKKVISTEEAKRIKQRYIEHQKKMAAIKNATLQDYLNVLYICYKAIFGNSIGTEEIPEIYKKYSPDKEATIFSIETEEQFSMWYESYEWTKKRSFDIYCNVFGECLSLYPPTPKNPKYVLVGRGLFIAWKYINIVRALIENNIPFEAPELDLILEYLTGKVMFKVNWGEPPFCFNYVDTEEYRKKYLPHIKWEPLKVPKWRE